MYVKVWLLDSLVTQLYEVWIPVDGAFVTGSTRNMYTHSLHTRRWWQWGEGGRGETVTLNVHENVTLRTLEPRNALRNIHIYNIYLPGTWREGAVTGL